MKHQLHLLRLTMLCAALCSATSLVKAQTEITEFRPGATLEGVNYFLPKVVLRVVVVAEKTVTLPGDFAPYADRYLRLRDVPTEESTQWTLRQLSLEPYGVPDSSKAYSLRVKSKTVAPLVSLTADGLLLGINTQVDAEPMPPLPVAVPATKPINPRDYMTQQILSAGSAAKMAQLTAEEIYDLRESRNALIRGEADNTPKDGAQLKLMLDNLDKQCAALESMFKGQQLTSTEVMSFQYEPSGEGPTERALLCRFSRMNGLVDVDDLSGEPVWISVKPLANLPQRAEVEGVMQKRQKMEQGVWVNQPVRALVTVFTAHQTLVSTEMVIPQLGTTEVLSDALFNKKPETRVTIYQHTGNVKQLSGAE